MSEEEMEEFDAREAARRRLQARQARLGITSQQHYDTTALRGVAAPFLAKKRILALIAVIIVLLILLVVGIQSCSSYS